MPDGIDDARALARRALAEDGVTDTTSELVGAQGLIATGHVVLRGDAVIAGLGFAEEVALLAGLAPVDWLYEDGTSVSAGTTIGRVSGDLAAVLRAERPLLNMLQRACGIATLTRKFVDAVAGTDCRILHTRKTAPGLRALDVSAVLAGGGSLHRVGLATQVLFKDNHWHALERRKMELVQTVAEARQRGISQIYVEVETRDQVAEAAAAGATRLLVDNQTPARFAEWCAVAKNCNPDVEMEASGGITLEIVRDYAIAGADFVSVGALTHSVAAADLALDIEAEK